MYHSISLYRVTSFRKPRGPWRRTRDQAQRDAEREGLGSFDEWGQFYATVPGDIEVATFSATLVRQMALAIEGEQRAA